ncbi:hypothetical protein AZE42_00724 [Rhizopogon vesiculosus]|uniref:Uncharacterized protein n=1 Tax=Rhizopogon vesiculosus TaxID=180088 RepID=A0A1J8QBN6_9AGAM|nr:hypothetical protein AZE42_00724 [Rhizopogon vesiculosus]
MWQHVQIIFIGKSRIAGPLFPHNHASVIEMRRLPCIHIAHLTSSITATVPSHPHPAAPPEWQMSFADTAAPQSSSTAPSSLDHPVFMQFWEAPARFSNPSSRYLEQVEIDAILVSISVRCSDTILIVVQSGGASLHK